MSVAWYSVDVSRWPLVVHSVEGSLSDTQVDDFVALGSDLLARGEPHVVVFDARKIGFTSAYTRSRSHDWLKNNHEALAKYCLGTAYVVSSPLVRFIVMTAMLFSRLPTPVLVCETLEEALAWGERRMVVATEGGVPG